jgi:tetratricopeptide (TPR) repeat protein
VVCFAAVWCIVNLAIYASPYPTNASLAEHWLYVPSLGFFLLAAAGGKAAMTRWPRRRSLIVGTSFLLTAALAWRTVSQNGYWSDPLRFYTQSIRLVPKSHLPEWYYNLGTYHLDRRENNLALQSYTAAVQWDARYFVAYHNIGVVSERLRRYDAAESAYVRALEINPWSVPTYLNLGNLLLRQGQYRRALSYLTNGARLCPGDAGLAEMIRGVRSHLAGGTGSP